MTPQGADLRRITQERAIAVRALRQIVSGRRQAEDEANYHPAFLQSIAIDALRNIGEYPEVQQDFQGTLS